MVATFTVEDGTGVVGANSYLSIANADQYHFDIGTAAASWDGKTDSVKQQALRDATRYLDTQYGVQWKGSRTDRVNVLDWPRSFVLDTDGFEVESNVVPQGLKDATAEAALRSLDATQNPTGLTPDLVGEGVIILKREKADKFEEETEYQGGLNQYVRFTVIDQLLHDLIDPTGSRLLERA